MATLRYSIREGVLAFFRPTFATFASLSIIAAMLLLASIIAVGMLNVMRFIDTAEDKAEMVAYVSDTTAADVAKLQSLASTIRNLPQVREAALIDKVAAWDRFASMYGKEMLSAVDENPLPVSFEISLKHDRSPSAAAATLQSELRSLEGIDTVRYAGEWLGFLERFRDYFFIASVLLAAVLFLALFMTISNAVRLTVYSRKELLLALRFMGATQLSITLPFILEGMLQGFAGGLIGEGAFYIVKALFTWETSLRMIPIFWGPAYLPALFLLLGVVLGWIGSAVAVRRFPA